MHHTTASIASLLSGELVGRPDLAVSRLDTIESAGAGALTFIRHSGYADKWLQSSAPAALITANLARPAFDHSARALIVVPNADLALIKLLELFAARSEPIKPGIHPSSVIDPSATVSNLASIGPHCIVGPRASIAEGCILHPNVTVEAEASVGRGTILHPCVVIGERCKVGQACILYGGVVVGADGFGYRPAPDGRGVIKIPHLGNVVIGDAVEIGANSCVDRAKFGSTSIGSGTKIDNLCQIGHNVTIGRGCIICGMCGLAGSCSLGDGVTLAAQVGIGDNVHIGDRATIAGKSGVSVNVPPGETWWGYPATKSRDMARSIALFRNLPELFHAVRQLSQKAGVSFSARGGKHDQP